MRHTKFTDIKDALETFIDREISIDIYESQWNKLPFSDWNALFQDKMPTNLFTPIMKNIPMGIVVPKNI